MQLAFLGGEVCFHGERSDLSEHVGKAQERKPHWRRSP